MKAYTSNNIRNIAVLGHGGKGKTTLCEAMLYVSGATDRLGKVAAEFDVTEKRISGMVAFEKKSGKEDIEQVKETLEVEFTKAQQETGTEKTIFLSLAQTSNLDLNRFGQDRELFEDILANTVSRKIRGKINASNMWVQKMNSLMNGMDTSSGLKLNLRWRSTSHMKNRSYFLMSGLLLKVDPVRHIISNSLRRIIAILKRLCMISRILS